VPLTQSPEPVLIDGQVNWEEVLASGSRGLERLAGGSAAYAARSCDAMGVRAHILTLGGDDADLGALEPHEVERVPAETLVLRHEFPEGARIQSLVQAPNRTIVPHDAPATWPEPATLILAPLLAEDVDVVSFIDEYPTAEVGLLAQGLQRAVLPDSRIAHRAQPASALIDSARPNVSIFLSEEEIALWPAGGLEHLVARSARVVVTRGAQGARVITRTGTREIAPLPVDAVDSTGAGDVFATAFILALRAGEEFAGRVAAALAAASCEVRGPGVLPSLNAIEARFHVGAATDGGRPA
jgi:ribokinase